MEIDLENDAIAYCEVEGDFDESGDVSLSHLASIRGHGGRRVVRDPNCGASRDP